MARQFAIYKGLQMPLVFKGFKGKFIYWGLAFLATGLVMGALTIALFNMYVGSTVLCGTIAGGLFFTGQQQRNGLHQKSRSSSIFIHQTSINHAIYHEQKQDL